MGKGFGSPGIRQHVLIELLGVLLVVLGLGSDRCVGGYPFWDSFGGKPKGKPQSDKNTHPNGRQASNVDGSE